VRTVLGVAVLSVCLGLTGCSLFGKKQTAQNPAPKPFMGSETTPQRETPNASTTPGGPLPGANGLLAGQVVDNLTGRPVKAAIEVKDLEDETTKAAALEVESDESGYFTIKGLKPGRHYKLIARAKEGGELASGYVIAAPPRPALYIQIDKRLTTPSTPAVPDPPKTPGKKNTPGTESGQEKPPAASLDAPIKIQPGKDPPNEGDPAPSSMGTGTGNSNPPNIANVAEGFARSTQDAPATINGPGQQYRTLPHVPPPPAPQWEGMQEERRPSSDPPPILPARPAGSVQLPNPPTRVPSCGLYGNKLDNFALKNVDGSIWEYRKDHRGRLTLLDFWYTSCGPCLQSIPYLIDLQRSYGAYGLEVIGIDCENGPIAEQRSRVMSVRGRYHINYTTLLSNGGIDSCPVVQQLQAVYFPMLVLLDESGNVIYRSTREGMDDGEHEALRRMIENRLFGRSAARTP
jgi:thiol-disulfide isomerase/thioredoxin